MRFLITHRAVSRACGKNQPKVLWSKFDICNTGSTVDQACLLHLAANVLRFWAGTGTDYYPVVETSRTLLPNNLLPNCSSPIKRACCNHLKVLMTWMLEIIAESLHPESFNPLKSPPLPSVPVQTPDGPNSPSTQSHNETSSCKICVCVSNNACSILE